MEEMKKLKYLVAPLLLIAVLLAGCGKTDISGEWKAHEAADIDKGSNANEYIFYKDGNYRYNNDGLALDKGTYEVDGNKIKLKGKDSKETIQLDNGKKTFKYNGNTFEKSDDE